MPIKSPISRSTPNQTSGTPDSQQGRGFRTLEVPDAEMEREEALMYQSSERMPPGMPPSVNPYAGRVPLQPPAPSHLEYDPHETDSYGRTQSDREAEVRAARRAKITGHYPISAQGRQRVELLAGLGRLTKDVPVEGVVFSIRTLKSREMREAVMAAAAVSRAETLFEGRRHQLARSIYRIDGQELAVVLGTDDIEAKLAFVEELDENVTNYVYEEFAKLNAKAQEKFTLKSDADIREAVEDVKK